MISIDEIQEQREALLDRVQNVYDAALNLIECVEKYLVQGVTRSTLVAAKDNLKKLIKENGKKEIS